MQPNGGWNTSGTTFKDGTEHVLKFYYLERGHNESNMMLRYNLIEPSVLKINKVDQFNKPVGGAVFGVYRGRLEVSEGGENKAYSETVYYRADDGTEVALSDKATVNGKYVISDGGKTFTPQFVGTTAAQDGTVNGVHVAAGELIFMDNSGTYYQPDELRVKFGTEFILRELAVPDGYRTVSDDAVLEFAGDMLVSKNPLTTGVWASPAGMVKATQMLYPAQGGDAIKYYTVNNNGEAVPNGTLFAVAQHRHVENAWKNLDDLTSWVAMYGTPDTGYYNAADIDPNQFPAGNIGALGSPAASIAVAKEQAKIGQPAFAVQGSAMEAHLVNLPGEANDYYSFVEQQYFDGDSGQIAKLLEVCPATKTADGNYDTSTRFTKCTGGNPQGFTMEQRKAMDGVKYTITYYWTSADSVDGADTTNTKRVHSHSGIPNVQASYGGFNILWESNVHIPNVQNRLFFQNFIYHSAPDNPDGADANTVWAGTRYALYKVGEHTKTNGDAVLYYVADSGEHIYLHPDPKRDGKLTDVAYVVNDQGEKVGVSGKWELDNESTDEAKFGTITVTIGDRTYTITPANNADGKKCVSGAITEDDVSLGSDHKAQNYFDKLYDGQYVLRQITAPMVPMKQDGKTGQWKYDPTVAEKYKYGINIEEVRVEVRDTAIYANAGSDRDGIAVGNGAGYLVRTLDQFASEGMLDETLTWIAMFLRVNYAKDFATFEKFLNAAGEMWHDSAQFGLDSQWTRWGNDEGELKDNNPYPLDTDEENPRIALSRGETTTLAEAMTTYLTYAKDSTDATFDFKVNDDQSARGDYGHGGQQLLGAGEGRLRLYTDSGWSMVNIYQDYTYGSENTQKNTEYQGLQFHELTPLFSNTTFVAFYNSPSTLPKIVKVQSGKDTWVEVTGGKDGTYLKDGIVTDICDGLNNMRTREENGNTVTQCRVEYNSDAPIKNAQFRVYKIQRDGNGQIVNDENGDPVRLYRTWDNQWLAETAATGDSTIKIFTSDSDGLIRDSVNWAVSEPVYVPRTGLEILPVEYVLEEYSAPVGFSIMNPSIKFHLTTSGSNGAITSIEFSGNEKDAYGISISPSGNTLYVENEPSVSIVKVRAGTEEHVTVQVDDPQNTSCVDIVADRPNDYKKFGGAVEKDPTNSKQKTCFVGYKTPVEGATFIISRVVEVDGKDQTQYYHETWRSGANRPADEEGDIRDSVEWVTDRTKATKLVSGEFGVISSLRLVSGNYTLEEIAAPQGYVLTSGNTKMNFTVFRDAQVQDGLRFEPLTSTEGMRLSEDRTVLYVENTPIPTIAKVEQGTEQYVTVKRNDTHKNATCAEVIADKANDYTHVGTLVSESDSADMAAKEADDSANIRCFAGYGTAVKGAKFVLAKGSGDQMSYYQEPQAGPDGTMPSKGTWVAAQTNATTFASAQDGFVLAVKETMNNSTNTGISGLAGTYTLIETEAPAGYMAVDEDAHITFTLRYGTNAATSQEDLFFHMDGSAEAGSKSDAEQGLRLSADNLTLYVENRVGVVLPSTGAGHLMWWLAIVAAVIGIALAIRWRLTKQAQ